LQKVDRRKDRKTETQKNVKEKGNTHDDEIA
jgi:hypothetical protein